MTLPQNLICSNSGLCSIMEVTYELLVTAVVDSMSPDIEFTNSVTIGNYSVDLNQINVSSVQQPFQSTPYNGHPVAPGVPGSFSYPPSIPVPSHHDLRKRI